MQGQRGVLQGIVIHICQQTELCNIWSDNICTCGQFLHGRQEFVSIHIIGHAVIAHYRINKKKDKLELVDILRCPRESGPRIIRFSDDGRFAYLLFELSNEVKVYSYDGSGKNPEFQLLQSITTLGKEDSNDALHNAASGMSLSADGKYLFCTTAGENTVTMYAVDQETGLLTKKFTLPISGDYPKDLMIFPDNKHIAVANHASNSITVFTVDYEKNIIMMNEKPRKIETPNSIHIWPVPDTCEQLD